MPLRLAIVCVPIVHNLLLKLLEGCIDGAYGLFHQNLEVSTFLVHLILEIQSLLLEVFHQFLTIHLQFQCLDISLSVILEMDKLLVDFLLHLPHVFLFVFGVKVKFVVVLGHAELAANAFVAELADADDLLWEVVGWTF